MTILSSSLLMFLVMDPFGNIPFFISALKNVDPKRYKKIVLRELFIALAVLLVFLFFGHYILRFLGISEPSLTISGGIILFLIAIKMIFLDNILYANTPNVAYEAHLAGYACGIIVTILLLATKLIHADHFDLWSMLRQWNRRRQFRDYNNQTAAGSSRKWVRAKEVKSQAQKEKEQQVADFRAKITNLIYNKNLTQAANCYVDLTQIDNDHILPRQQQLDIANQLMSMSKWHESAHAYEIFLAHYQNCQYSEQVELMLGVIYARYLHKPDLAVKNLQAARQKIADPGQIKTNERHTIFGFANTQYLTKYHRIDGRSYQRIQ